MDDARLPDGMETWAPEVVAEYLQAAISEYAIDTVIWEKLFTDIDRAALFSD